MESTFSSIKSWFSMVFTGGNGKNDQPWVSVANMCNAIVGAGVISFPFGYRQTGAVGGILFTILVWAIEIVSVCILIRAAERHQATTYHEIVTKALSREMGIVIAITMLVYLTGSLIAYFILVGDIFHPMFASLFGNDSILGDRRIVILIFATLVVLPLALNRTIESLKYTSLVSVVMLLYIAVALVWMAFASFAKHGGPSKDIKLFTFSFKSFIALDIFVFAFHCHIQAVGIFGELVDRPRPMWPCQVTGVDSKQESLLHVRSGRGQVAYRHWSRRVRTMDIVIFTSLGFCLIGYIMVGEFGYLAFPHVESDLLRSFQGNNPFLTVARVGMAMVAMACYPLCSHPARTIINDWIAPLLHNPTEFSWALHIPVTMLIWGAALAASITITDLGLVFSLVGSTGGVVFIFVIPAFLLFSGCPLFLPRGVSLNPAQSNPPSPIAQPIESGTPRKRTIVELPELVVGGLLMFSGGVIFVATTYANLVKHAS